MLEDFLSKLGASTKITIGVAVSPGLGLEMIEVDRATGTVNKYGYKPTEYNSSTREITDYDQFAMDLEELFEDLHIPKKSNIVISLPNVHFGMISLPLLLTDEAITNAIISEAEQSYIFKRQEPVVSWTEVYTSENSENRTLAYTAIQKEVLDRLTEICNDIGCTLVGIENSYSSLFRALHYTHATKEQMKDNVSWNLMIIMQNNYSIISMNGKKVIDYYEEPLALKSFVDDEIYNAIKTSAQLTLAGLPANYLYIVSETDLVSAEVLSIKMPFEGTVNFLECNKFAHNELLPVNLNILAKNAIKITPEAIGVAVHSFCDFPLKLNALQNSEGSTSTISENAPSPKINIGNLEVELTPDFIKKVSLIIGGTIILPFIILFAFLHFLITPKEQAKLDTLNQQITTINTTIKQYQDTSKGNEFNANAASESILSDNKLKTAYYSALGMSIPADLWVTKFSLSGKGKIDIQGKAKEVKSIYVFYKNMKQLVNNSDIRLYKLELASGTVDNIILDNYGSSQYSFEITNMSESELNPPPQQNNPNNPNGGVQQPMNGQPMNGQPMNGQPGMQNGMPGNQPQTGSPMGQPTQPGAPTPVMQQPMPNSPQPSPPSGNGQLPPNLQKIEKF